jgi:type II secretory pathway pseudopilin PulG
MKYLKNIIDFINKYSSLLLIIGIIILILLLSVQCNRKKQLKQQQIKDKQNISALNDSITTEKLKNGALQISINGFVATQKELKSLNADLYNQVKAQKGNVLSLSNVILKLTQDTVQLRKYLNQALSQSNQTIPIGNNKYSFLWTLKFTYDVDNFDLFQGKTNVDLSNPLNPKQINTELFSRITQINLSFGQKIEDNKLRIFVESKYPGFTVESLKGVLIDPNESPYIRKLMKKKHWFNGWQIGFGITPGLNLATGNYSLVVGPTFSWNIYNF